MEACKAPPDARRHAENSSNAGTTDRVHADAAATLRKARPNRSAHRAPRTCTAAHPVQSASQHALIRLLSIFSSPLPCGHRALQPQLRWPPTRGGPRWLRIEVRKARCAWQLISSIKRWSARRWVVSRSCAESTCCSPPAPVATPNLPGRTHSVQHCSRCVRGCSVCHSSKGPECPPLGDSTHRCRRQLSICVGRLGVDLHRAAAQCFSRARGCQSVAVSTRRAGVVLASLLRRPTSQQGSNLGSEGWLCGGARSCCSASPLCRARPHCRARESPTRTEQSHLTTGTSSSRSQHSRCSIRCAQLTVRTTIKFIGALATSKGRWK